MDVLQMGAARRTTAATLMNSASSRSHAVFTVTVESNPAAGSDAEDSDAGIFGAMDDGDSFSSCLKES